MNSTVFVKSYDAPSVDKSEVFRYLTASCDDENTKELVNEALFECKEKFSYKVCYAEFPIEFKNGEIDFGFMKSDSTSLIKNLSGCKSAVVFGATVGIEIDRLIYKYGKISPSKAIAFQAIGAERVECLCDMFCKELEKSKEDLYLRPRFSPGYGDFDLSAQKEIFKVLDCPKKIGLTLNESLIMSPSKSVTAIVGMSEYKDGCDDKRCENCNMEKCLYKR